LQDDDRGPLAGEKQPDDESDSDSDSDSGEASDELENENGDDDDETGSEEQFNDEPEQFQDEKDNGDYDEENGVRVGDDTALLEPDEPADGDAKRTPAESRRRKLFTALFCGSGLIAILIIVLASALTAGDGSKKDSRGPKSATADISPPSSAPSVAPSLATAAPTFYPAQIIYPVIADTYLISGSYSDFSFGLDLALVVKGGGVDGNVTDDEAWALLEFDLTGLPDENENRQSQILLQLSPIIQDTEQERDIISVYRLPDDLDIDVEAISFDEYPPEPGIPGPTFSAILGEPTILVDITALVRGKLNVRKDRRWLQAGDQKNGTLYLQLVSQDANSRGESFWSRERGEETAPRIIHNFITESPSEAPSISSAPSSTPAPTNSTVSTAPTTMFESDFLDDSTAPSLGPSIPPVDVIPL
jgi:hypothetical protein